MAQLLLTVIFCNAIFLSLSIPASGHPKVTSIKPNLGSKAGGLLLEVLGEGFSEDQFSLDPNVERGNKVYFVYPAKNDTLECDIITSDTNSKRILCETRECKYSDADYHIRVEVDGKRLNDDKPGTYCNSQCKFYVRDYCAPTYTRLEPRAGEPVFVCCSRESCDFSVMM